MIFYLTLKSKEETDGETDGKTQSERERQGVIDIGGQKERQRGRKYEERQKGNHRGRANGEKQNRETWREKPLGWRGDRGEKTEWGET